MGVNTSQDPEYYGPTGHEKKFHKTHFHVNVKLKLRTTRDNGSACACLCCRQADRYEWVRVGVGRYKRVKKDDRLNRRHHPTF